MQFRLALPMACMTILPAAQLDISSQAAKAVRALTFQHVPKPSLPQLFRRQADREKINVIFAQVGDPKIPVLGTSGFQCHTTTWSLNHLFDCFLIIVLILWMH